MTTKKLLLINGLLLSLLGIIYFVFSAKISTLVFPELEFHMPLIQVYQFFGIHLLSLGALSFLIRNVKSGSSLEKNILLGYALYWLMASLMGFYHLNKGTESLLSIHVIHLIFTLIFGYYYVKARKKN